MLRVSKKFKLINGTVNSNMDRNGCREYCNEIKTKEMRMSCPRVEEEEK